QGLLINVLQVLLLTHTSPPNVASPHLPDGTAPDHDDTPAWSCVYSAPPFVNLCPFEWRSLYSSGPRNDAAQKLRGDDEATPQSAPAVEPAALKKRNHQLVGPAA